MFQYEPFTHGKLKDLILANKIAVEYVEGEDQFPSLRFYVKDQKNYDKVMKHIYAICPAMYWGGCKIVEKFKSEESCN